ATPNIRCVTRWRPEEIAAGASDLEVLDLIRARPRARLYIHPLLHAKFFRVDRRCLVGSANLTQRALGWTVPSNFELMLELPADEYGLSDFEETLFAEAFEATEQYRNDIASAAEIMRAAKLPQLISEEALITENPESPPAEVWL